MAGNFQGVGLFETINQQHSMSNTQSAASGRSTVAVILPIVGTFAMCGLIRTMAIDPQRLDQARQGPHLRRRRAACRVAARLKADAHGVTRELRSVAAGNSPIPLGNSSSVNPFF
jgi:hypothetical protein